MGQQHDVGYRLHIASGFIRMDLRDSSANAVVSAYTLASQSALVGSWHHLAVTYDGRGGASAAAGLAIYIDGVPVPVTRNNNAAYVSMENLAAPLQIGRRVRVGNIRTARSTKSGCGTWRGQRARFRPRC